jgi:hypothetical protein
LCTNSELPAKRSITTGATSRPVPNIRPSGACYIAPWFLAPTPQNTNTGTDCNYLSKGSKLWFRAYVDPSPAAATDLFARLSAFYAPPTPVKGLGDEAYFDPQHAIHVRKGKVRYYLNLSPLGTFTPAKEKQLKDLAVGVAGRL